MSRSLFRGDLPKLLSESFVPTHREVIGVVISGYGDCTHCVERPRPLSPTIIVWYYHYRSDK